MSKILGDIGERQAVCYLQQLGFTILERNFYAKFGEIDIVALKDDVVHFIEVKYSKSYDPLERITPSKMAKIIKTAKLYMAKRAEVRPFCIDALIIQSDTVELIENISII
ncbi:MAG: YraN family protein [Epsilonproteobacteria bacterium]|nr:YraN family protein [Campylobacterota bacterium]NPA63835.1 YraN family protein [Campylobacterota bacterium]